MNEQDKKFYFIALIGLFAIAEILLSVISSPFYFFGVLGAGQLVAIMLFSEMTNFLNSKKEKVG